MIVYVVMRARKLIGIWPSYSGAANACDISEKDTSILACWVQQ